MKIQHNQVDEIRTNPWCIVVQTALLIILTFALPSPNAFSSENAYVFIPGDKLLVTVFGHEELSGEYTIDNQGLVQLPVGAPIKIGGATLQVSQKLLRDHLEGNKFLKNPQVSVRIAELRPVFVIGAVKRPGSFPFRFGMTVAEVIALAGGFGLEEVSRSSIPELFAAEERLATLKQNRRNLRIRLARIDAELGGENNMILPENIRLDQNPVTQSTIKNQEALLLLSVNQLEHSVELIQKQIPRVEAEIAALRKERKAAERRVKLATDYANIYENLRGKGLARANTTLNTQTAIALHEGTVARIDARLSNLSQSKGLLAIELQKLDRDRFRRLKEEKQKTVTDLNRTEVLLPFAEKQVLLNSNSFGVGVFADQEKLPYKLFRSRRADRAGSRTEVDLFDSILSGDLIDVRVTLRRQNIDLSAARALEYRSLGN